MSLPKRLRDFLSISNLPSATVSRGEWITKPVEVIKASVRIRDWKKKKSAVCTQLRKKQAII